MKGSALERATVTRPTASPLACTVFSCPSCESPNEVMSPLTRSQRALLQLKSRTGSFWSLQLFTIEWRLGWWSSRAGYLPSGLTIGSPSGCPLIEPVIFGSVEVEAVASGSTGGGAFRGVVDRAAPFRGVVEIGGGVSERPGGELSLEGRPISGFLDFPFFSESKGAFDTLPLLTARGVLCVTGALPLALPVLPRALPPPWAFSDAVGFADPVDSVGGLVGLLADTGRALGAIRPWRMWSTTRTPKKIGTLTANKLAGTTRSKRRQKSETAAVERAPPPCSLRRGLGRVFQ